MSGDSLMFDEFIALCDEQYEYGLIEFKNGDVVNGPGENDGSAKVLSYAALANFDKDATLKVSCCGDSSPTLSLSLSPPHKTFFRFRPALRTLIFVIPHPIPSKTPRAVRLECISSGVNTTGTSSPPPIRRITRTFVISSSTAGRVWISRTGSL